MKPLTAILLALGLLGAAAGPAAAASLAPLKPCYVFGGYDQKTGEYDAEPVELDASGFLPGAATRVVVDGVTVASGVRADAAGRVRFTARAPVQDSGERPFTVSVTDEADPAQTAAAASRVTTVAVSVSPRKGPATQRVRFRGRGFTNLSRPVFGHYVKRGRERRTVRFARRPGGPCGTFRATRRRLPFERPATGRWRLRVDQSRRYRAEPAGPFVDLSIQVRRALRLESRRD